MTRVAWLVVALLAVSAAGPTRGVPASRLPVPPIPPPNPPSDQLAPMPNADAFAPAATSLLPNVTIKDFRADGENQGLGYTPGSQFETSEDKRLIQTPGLSWKVPLQ